MNWDPVARLATVRGWYYLWWASLSRDRNPLLLHISPTVMTAWTTPDTPLECGTVFSTLHRDSDRITRKLARHKKMKANIRSFLEFTRDQILLAEKCAFFDGTEPSIPLEE